ncbi:probable phospholipase A2 homolog 1 [Olea europaea subsp. europaea]|uniref:Probable phospholipase A2 homolog 1 n=1 Tax=Olea europaea subsp. europaea TaxID=158383 RepID=A0A8S0SEY6_OLEEU|nr:probable phospholipase A2 homolog 1 [Olea europaea subsp. europaea]
MLPGNAIVTGRRRVATAFVFFMFLTVIAESNNSQVRCSKTCVAENCNCEPVNDSLVKTLFHFIFVFIFIFYYSKCVAAVGIKYGKYCGVGWTGCPGEKPCDDLDACCKIHDECVEKKGLTNIKCHEKFKRCIKKVQKSGKIGFSNTCPYDTAVPTMVQGMDMAILFSQFGNSKLEL